MSDITPPDQPRPSTDAAREMQRELPPANDLAAVKYEIPSMHPEGTKFVAAAAVLALVFWFILDWEILGWLTAGLALWIFTFFRDPVRTTPDGEDLIVSPADGLVSQIVETAAPRELIGSASCRERV